MAVPARALVPEPIGRSARAVRPTFGQKLDWLFFYVARGLALGLALAGHALLGFVELLFQLFETQFDLLECFSFHPVRQREFGRKQNIFLGDRRALYERGMCTRTLEDHEIGAVTVDLEPGGQFGNGIQIGLGVGDGM